MSTADPTAYTLRAMRADDLNWVIERHRVLYEQEYGWHAEFEGLVAQVASDFLAAHDETRERGWIAERTGADGAERIGSVLLVRHSEREGVARLRLLLLEPSARGMGLGKRLVDECTHFARAAGYHTITLWTNSVLLAARGIYQRAGYRLVDTEPYHGFGHDLVGETWELTL